MLNVAMRGIMIRRDSAESLADALAEYATVPIAFEVRERLVVDAPMITTAPVTPPWIKDYDGLESPLRWAEHFDVSRWIFFSAWEENARVGGATLVHDVHDVRLLDDSPDVALLWDIRVAPAQRGMGIGTALLSAVEREARVRGAERLRVETQDINVPACRFYERHGFRLASARADAYPAFPDEIELLWEKRLH